MVSGATEERVGEVSRRALFGFKDGWTRSCRSGELEGELLLYRAMLRLWMLLNLLNVHLTQCAFCVAH